MGSTKQYVKILVIIIGLLMAVATLLPISRSDWWWVRIFDFPRLQITLVLLAAAIAYAAFISKYVVLDNLFLGFLAACLIYQGFMMYPYTPFAAHQVELSSKPDNKATVSILFANVLMDNRNSAELIRIIEAADPDIILTVETDDWWREQLKGFEQSHPFTVIQPQDDTYGMIFYSRLELLDGEVKFLVEDNVPSIHGRVRLASGDEVEIRCLHPPPPFPTEDERSTERDAELLIVGKEIKRLDRPAVVFGDLNDVAWSRTNYLFQDISGLLDPRIGRGFYNTFHADYPFMRFPLDHCFHSSHFRLIDFRRLDYFGSDHFPVYINLSFEPDAEATQEPPPPDTDQKIEADQKINKKMAEDQPPS